MPEEETLPAAKGITSSDETKSNPVSHPTHRNIRLECAIWICDPIFKFAFDPETDFLIKIDCLYIAFPGNEFDP